MSHAETVGKIYEAFGRGDIPAILERLSPTVEWEAGAPPTDIPWMQPRQGRQAVQGFFEALGALDFTRFQPTAVLESGLLVVALIDVAFTVRATGRTVVENDEVHIWRFDQQGLVTSFRHRVDTRQQAAALTGAG
jgi:ketosteroid isomerase-like protein